MSIQLTTETSEVEERPAHWGGVFAMTLCVFALIASEFMPVSLLTPIASDLQVSEGQAGQGIAISGVFAVLTSLSITSLAGRMDRKLLLLLLTLVMAASGTVVALAQNYPLFMLGRVLIGVVIGGFWSMSAAIAIRLVPGDQVPKALAIFNAGNALATVIAAPLGSFLGAIVGWRGAFFVVVPVALLVLVWQWISLPSMKVDAAPRSANVIRLLRRPVVLLGMASVGMFFMGQFAVFTYVRPFLETVTRVDITTLSLILLAMGIAGFMGTSLIGIVLRNHIYRSLIAIPVLMAIIAGSLIIFGDSVAPTAALLAAWGLFGTAAPVGWWTWLAKSLPKDAEAGGGLMVAVVQLAITLGATVGGLLFDMDGYQSACAGAILLSISALLGYATSRASRLQDT
ncbi:MULTISPECIES: MFS transporter [Rhizobium]|uniref:MFS transporter n=1 Tax=Rhizobium phaseoli TaxID=396 RepID=UPI000A1C18F2|nr:MFS transporter [Rhizobium phaseoli]ARM16090.1 ribonucleoside transporter protein [Rhizobium phaseoli Brasil 5]